MYIILFTVGIRLTVKTLDTVEQHLSIRVQETQVLRKVSGSVNVRSFIL